MGRKRRYWIQDAIRHPGALSRQLGIPIDEDIPITLLRKIKSAEIGDVIRNPTKTGKRRITVTNKLKKRAVLALTLRELRRKKR